MRLWILIFARYSLYNLYFWDFVSYLWQNFPHNYVTIDLMYQIVLIPCAWGLGWAVIATLTSVVSVLRILCDIIHCWEVGIDGIGNMHIQCQYLAWLESLYTSTWLLINQSSTPPSHLFVTDNVLNVVAVVFLVCCCYSIQNTAQMGVCWLRTSR